MKRKIISFVLAVSVMASTFVCMNLGSVSASSDDIGKYAWENFESMTGTQAENYFTGDKDGTVSQAISDNGENGSKGLTVSIDFPYSWNWINYCSDNIEIPENAIGVRMWYSVSENTSMRLQLRDKTKGAWTNIAFEGSKESKGSVSAGTYEKTVLFSGTEYDSTHVYGLGLEVASISSGASSPSLTIDNITFITSESYENFESMADEQASSYFTGDKDANVTQAISTNGEKSSKALSITMNYPYKWCWINYSSAAFKIDNSVIGISMWYSVSEDTSMRLQLKDQTKGAWTDIAFEGSKAEQSAVSAGTYKKTIYFAGTDYDNSHIYGLGLESKNITTESSEVVLTIDNIEFIRYGTSQAGDNSTLIAQINEIKAVAEGDSSLYREESWNTFMTAYNNAVLLAGDVTATQRQLDQAKDTLKAAFDALEPVTVIKTILKTKLDAVKTILEDSDIETKYTSKSIETLTKSYNTAKGVYEDANAAQSEVNKQVTALENAVKALKKIPSEAELVYSKANDKLIMDFEHFIDSIDLGTLDFSTSHPFQMDSGLKNTLETKTPISGEKSWRIGWKTLGDDFWGAERMYMFNGYLENQAMYMDIVCPNDWNGSFSVYDEAASVVYDYEMKIDGSNKVQHIVLPFNQFKHDGVAMTNTEWESFRQGAIIFKININKALGGLPDNSFMIIDNMTLVTLDGLKTPYEYNYTTLPTDEDDADKGDEGNNGDQDNDGDDGNVNIDGNLGSGYTEIKNFETPVKNFELSSSELKDLVGSGMYFNVKSSADDVIKVILTDGTVLLKYEIEVKASDSNQLVNVEYTDITSALRTFGEIDRSKMTVNATFENDGTISTFGSYNYAEIYAANFGTGDNDNNNDENNDNGPSNDNDSDNSGSSSPQTGDATKITLFAMLGVIALGICLIVRKVAIENK